MRFLRLQHTLNSDHMLPSLCGAEALLEAEHYEAASDLGSESP